MFNLLPWKAKSHGGDGGSLAPYNPNELSRLRNEFDALWDRFWAGPPAYDDLFGGGAWSWGVSVDDNENEVVIHAEAPGFEPDELNLQVRGNHLFLEAEHKEEQKDNRSASYRYGKLRRTVPLPHGVDADKVDARYHNGVLHVRIPKSEEAKGKRIMVRAE